MSGKPLVSIITVNFNQSDLTAALILSLSHDPYENTEIIVVDNGSKKEDASALKKRFEHIVFVKSDVNLGFAGGNNLGIKAAKGKYLFFVNNDTEFTAQTIGPLVKLLEENPKIGIVSPKIIYYNSSNIIQYAGSAGMNSWTGRSKTIGQGELDEGRYDVLRPTPIIDGAAMMVPKCVIEKVGDMPELFFLYYEELDWCEQIKRAGYLAYYNGNATIYHKESMSVGKHSVMKTYYMNRNRLLFIRRNYVGLKKLSGMLVFLLFAIPKRIVKLLQSGDWQHIKALFKGLTWNLKN